MNSKKSLSIVIPAFNEEHYIQRCLEAIANQSVPPDEVIVVDNNSTDKTVEISKKYSFVKLVKEHKQGISHAHHRGFNSATSDLIARIDADSILPTDWVSQVLNQYSNPQNNSSVFVGSGYCANLKFPKFHTILMDSAFVGARLLLGFYAVWGPNSVIPKESWDKVADETCEEKPTMYDDLDLGIHLHNKGIKIYWNRDIRVGVRIKHLHSPLKFFKYTLRWPGTLRNHRDPKWLIAWPLTFLLTAIQYPIFLILRKKSS